VPVLLVIRTLPPSVFLDWWFSLLKEKDYNVYKPARKETVLKKAYLTT